MTEFCTRPEIMLSLLDEIGRHRALEPHEVDMLEDLIALEVAPFKWNPRLERQLLTAAASPGGLTRFAKRHGIDRLAVYQKLSRMRKRHSRKMDARALKVQEIRL